MTDRDIHDAYDFCGPVLGKGSFATVLRVRDRVSGSEYAVKQVLEPPFFARVCLFLPMGVPSSCVRRFSCVPGRHCKQPIRATLF